MTKKSFFFQANELLDELLKVFSPKEITSNIWLLNHSVAHVKIRVSELSGLDNAPISPEIINLSNKKFSKFLEEFLKNK